MPVPTHVKSVLPARKTRAHIGLGGKIGIWLRPMVLAVIVLAAVENCQPVDDVAAAEPEADSAVPARKVDFGREVRPLLAKRCYSCHGPDKAKGGLRLNVRDAALAELDSGAHAIVPGDVENSELVNRVASTDKSDRMPPEGAPLSSEQVDLLRRWVAQGAVWEEHWAFQRPVPQAPPAVKNPAWVRTPIDAFILHKLEQNQLAPSAPADKRVLMRRAYYDLTGLPPTPEEAAAFLQDAAPDAYERLIDRLLASPRYGERWGRHWLDVVRYADTNSFERDGVKPHAWRYRDYVIRAFNEDRPYDQFVREQLAGDELPQTTNDGLIATGYYRLGLWDDEPADRQQATFDVLDDIVATTGQVFLGLTVNCARCHDHKIDPIPQRDYYSLVSFFRGVTPMAYSGPNVEVPIFPSPAAREEYAAKTRDLQARVNAAQSRVTGFEESFRGLYEKSFAAALAPGANDLDDLEFRFYRDTWSRLPVFDDLKPETVGRLPDQVITLAPATRDTGFGFVFTGVIKAPRDGDYTFTLDADDGARLIVDGKPVVEYDGEHELGSPRQGSITLAPGRVPFRLEYFQKTHKFGLNLAWSGPEMELRPLSARPKHTPPLHELIRSHGARLLGKDKFDEYERSRGELEKLKHEKIPAEFALCVTEFGRQPPDTFILARGNAHVAGEKVEPAFPVLFAAPQPVIPPPAGDAKSSGRRLALANWVASPDNLLTARVMVNRVWQHHFGRGIVRSPNNFGQLGDRPTHPELLDWLAAEFIRGGWKLKSLHKLIMTSSAWQMSSQGSPEGLQRDPANELFWRFDMRRLGAEEVRDSIYAVNGRLNLKMYGPGVYPEIPAEVMAGQSVPGQGWGKSSPEEQARRSVYIHVKRSLITPVLADFDFADTDGSCAARFATTQPTQALSMLNSRFIHAAAADFAERLWREAPNDPVAQVRRGLKLALCRDADEREVQEGIALMQVFETKHGHDRRQALNLYCLLILNLNEFMYVD